MNIKVNKLKICILVVFVVLLFANVQATELSITPISEVAGSGSKDDPYIIDISAGGTLKTIKFRYKSLPFYFVVKDGQEGSYEIFHEPTEQTVTFRFVDSASNGIKVMLDTDEYNDLINWQVGVNTILNKGTGATMPTYAIYEEINYCSKKKHSIDEFHGGRPDYTMVEIVKDEYNSSRLFGDSFIELDNERISVNKMTKLYNAVVNGPVLSSKPNHYFFTTSKSYSDVVSLLEPMNYQLESSDNKFDRYKNKTSLKLASPIICIANGEGIDIVYKFAGNTNTALDDAGIKNDIESLVTRLLVSIGDNVLLVMLRNTLGKDLSIDSLIFNRFEKTKIQLYKKTSNSINQVLRNVINYWYGILSNITYIAYLIILVYIGIMIILSAGTERQSKMRSYLGNWVVGLVILLFLPTYGIPFLFDLNDAFVNFIGRNASTMNTYYNDYDVLLSGDIPGSDSATVSIEELTGMRAELQESYDTFSKISEQFMKSLKLYIKNYLKEYEENNGTITTLNSDLDKITSMIDSCYNSYKAIRDSGKTSGEAGYEVSKSIKLTINKQNNYVSEPVRNAVYDILFNQGYFDKLINQFEDVYIAEHDLGVVDRMINILKSDIMGTMRDYAGKYQKLVFAFIWYMLLFQLIGLTFLYFKRIFVIAILIAVFPLIMLFYCIDKMTDGKAQTFSLWFKELLSNIFIQSVHAVIYTILVEMGLTIYKNDPGNWIFLVAAMLMLIPAEGIMKELFGLNGSTLGKIGGSLMNVAAAIGTARAFATSWRGKNDASMQEKNNKRFDKLQRRQDRADTRARTREAKRAGNMNNYTGNKYNKDNLGTAAKLREKAYEAGTAVRSAKAKAAPTIDNAARVARNVTATTAGALYGMSGGDIESMAQGAQFAKEFSGVTKNLSESDIKIKTELKSALDRKNGKK